MLSKVIHFFIQFRRESAIGGKNEVPLNGKLIISGMFFPLHCCWSLPFFPFNLHELYKLNDEAH